MKKTPILSMLVLTVMAVGLLASCTAHQEYAYLKTAPRHIPQPIKENYGTTIFPGDRLHIDVFSQNPESTLPFNQEVMRLGNDRFLRDTLHVSNTRGYLVDDDGSIIFPLIGQVQAAGLTLDSLSHSLETALKAGNYVSDPLVSVRLTNFHVTVIGEVKNPSLLHSDGNRLTLLEALAQCGDITMDAKPNCVVIVRQTLEGEVVDTVDLTSSILLESPYYYLQQNDIVYVSPTEKRRRTAWRNEDWPRYISMSAAALSLAYMTVYRIIRAQTPN